MELIYIIIINLSLAGILFTIFLTSMMHKKYRLPFLSTYLYFQIFLAIFGTYGVLVPGIIRVVLANQEISTIEVENISHFFTFLGFPFLVLCWYMFLRCCHELVDTSLPTCLTLSYLVIWFLFFTGYGILLYFFQDVSDRYFPLIPQLIGIIIGGLALPVLFHGTITLVISGRRKEQSHKQALFRFALLNLIIFSGVITLLLLNDKHQYIGAAFIFLFFTSSVLPVISIRSYLIQSIPVPESKLEGIGNMEQFIDQFGISKREEEIIQQICLGKSNKEISENLFITIQTVKDHVYRIFLKTGVKNRIQLSNLIRKLETLPRRPGGNRKP
jgi:DNA-binding CsgD family transcriptional regulator